MESRKMVLMNRFSGQQWRCRQREQTYGCVVGWGGRRGSDEWRENMETYTLAYAKQIVNESLLFDLGNSN